MTTTVAHNAHTTRQSEFCGLVAFALNETLWQRGFTPDHGQKPRERTMAVRDLKRSAGAWRIARCPCRR
jgi:hypothetical protein